MTVNEAKQKRKVRKSLLLFAGIALFFYAGFILLAVLRA